MQPSRLLRTTEPRGGPKGIAFDDTPLSADLDTAVISGMTIHHDKRIDILQVHYRVENKQAAPRGEDGGYRADFTLENDEFIEIVMGNVLGGLINHLTFVTNKRMLGPYGTAEGSFFRWHAAEGVPNHMGHRMALLSFQGYSGGYVNQLQATFADHPGRQDVISTVKYERVPTALTDDLTPTSTTQDAPAILSRFARHLMAPNITIYAGPKCIKFHAQEDILCQLPFFTAALQGHFKEAADKTIAMPEDDPAIVAPLVEFLYTGNYTYPFGSESTEFKPLTDIPVGDLAQGLYHISVHAIALKYDCTGLTHAAVNNFKAVLKDVDGIELLHLLCGAYNEGFHISDWEIRSSPQNPKGKLTQWAVTQFREHSKEMESTMHECPSLSCDLLRIAANAACKEIPG